MEQEGRDGTGSTSTPITDRGAKGSCVDNWLVKFGNRDDFLVHCNGEIANDERTGNKRSPDSGDVAA
jgi:hypothetical protein